MMGDAPFLVDHGGVIANEIAAVARLITSDGPGDLLATFLLIAFVYWLTKDATRGGAR